MKDSRQRIKLRLIHHPVKLDATVLEMDPDGGRLKVRFDGPLEDAVLYRYSDDLLVSRKLENGEVPSQFPDGECMIYEVL